MTFTRTELFWLAYLWWVNHLHQAQVREFHRRLDAAYAEIGERLNRLILRPTPLLEKLR